MPAVLQQLTRHSTIDTTLRYYADLDAEELADGLWRNYNNTLPDFHLPLRTRDY
jgi:hypothetical protein